MELKKYFLKNQINELLSFQDDFGITNLSQGEKGFFISLFEGNSVFIVNDFISASTYKAQFDSLKIKSKIVNVGFDSPIFVFSQDLTSIKNLIDSISQFNNKNIQVLIVVCNALFQKVSKDFKGLFFEKTNKYDYNQIIKNLVNLGYRKTAMVSCQGEFAVRGDILDIFAICQDNPFRLEFFDDELEDIYSFSFENMEKTESYQCLTISPNTIFFNCDFDNLQDKILGVSNENRVANLKLSSVKQDVLAETNKQSNNIKLAWNLIFEKTTSFLKSLQADRVFFDEPKRLIQTANLINTSNKNTIFSLYESGLVGKEHFNFFTELDKIFDCNLQKISFENFQSNEIFKPKRYFEFRVYPNKKYLYDYNALVNDIKLYNNVNDIILCAGDLSTKHNLTKYLIGQGLTVCEDNLNPLTKHFIKVLPINLAQSVMIDGYPLMIATGDLVKKSSNPAKKKKSSAFLPKVNDYVVHDFHGIGKCKEIKRIKIGDIERDYFVIEYNNGDLLYLPTEQVDSISAYVGGEESPKLNKLGGLEFSKLKQRVKENIKELAFDLLKLYSERSKIQGFKFVEDDVLQQQFEDCFEYEETPDQLVAIEDIKADMTSGKIMDRLVCGDVGYGKTEVAFRAIFKAILSGKQVAFMCPTTILAQQHYKNAIKRFKDFGIRIKVLNRLVPLNVQKQIIKEIGEGKVELVIGTHRLLSDDIIFKDLGLLVLDEEQRFGVGDKEKLKNLKKDISVLTLSATPIPRTLHMSLTGIRDISLIETAPKSRLPVQSFVCEFDEDVIKEACLRELNREGQIFIVYNRVDTIYDFAHYIQNLLPEVRIGVAHGQMASKMLEDAVLKLYNGEYQILIATSLIENGIDIPQANTLIVVDSDKLGLSSLYQLKGRIGRSNILAYAYFTYKKDKILTEDAYKRLQAISEFSSLGSGFKIALRDLEIRGAGNLLGSKQHGHIEKIGYDLYSRLLDDTLKEIEGKKQQQIRATKIDVKFDSYIPDEFIPDEQERIRIYNEISTISSAVELDETLTKIDNTYGSCPDCVKNLTYIALCKNLAQQNGVKSVIINNETAKLYLYKDENIICEHLHENLQKYKNDFVLKFENLPIIELNNQNSTVFAKLMKIINLLS